MILAGRHSIINVNISSAEQFTDIQLFDVPPRFWKKLQRNTRFTISRKLHDAHDSHEETCKQE